MSVKIVVDSSVDMPSELKKEIEVIPLTVRFGNEEFVDSVTINHQQFYEKLIESDELPTTSQASPASFEEVFKKIVSSGDTAVVITISSELSGTYQSARIAATEYEGSVFTVDSRNVSIGAGILAEKAIILAKEGKSASEISETLIKERENVKVIALLDTLEYLKKGGRISKTVAFAGGMLSIKPVVTIEDGKIAVLGKARGSKQANNFLVTEIKKAGGVDFSKPLLLGYTGLTDIYLKKYIEDSKSLWQDRSNDLEYTVIGSVIGTHAGPGAVAVAFFKG